ncbi:hypothetical protein KUTeg_019461 [Tegillarca granosa]|uniref:gamma-glutamylcyclotransferase n=1 Tax=Tegillarca granosa TaxID=220873 RepID=A0ABQ9ED11_TEGGR|nr:hypothetical protein KUTeg_019461 [Tegillarca granosa]
MNIMKVSEGSFWYFGFGSNLLKQRIKLKNPSAVFITNAKLNGYRLSFSSKDYNPHTCVWHGGGATLIEDPDSFVWGCVWKLKNEDIKNLDKQEYTYEPITVEVVSPQNEVYICRSYHKDLDDKLDNRPSPQYKDIVLRGAEQNQLPEDYIDMIRNVEDNGFSGQLELYDEIISQIKHADA